AGMSGLYGAWRLLGAAPAARRPRITVFEGSGRVGGRLLSVTPPGLPGTWCELGGMRVMSRHVLVNALLGEMGLAGDAEPMPVSEPDNIAFLRGLRLRQRDLAEADRIPYQLREDERAALAQGLLMKALVEIVPDCVKLAGRGIERLRLEMRSATFHGTPLHRLGFWNVLARVLSPDGYAFVRDSGGYDCLVSNWSAADASPFILADFGSGVTYSRFRHGFHQLPQKLAHAVQARGGTIEFHRCLASFDVEPAPGGGTQAVLRFRDGRVVRAKKLVLAMPRRSLELLDPTGAVLGPQQRAARALIETVEPIPLFKIFLSYRQPWWEKAAGVSTGRSLTDLPIRQCYYWGTEAKGPGSAGGATLLASYDDDQSVSFWAGLRSTRGLQRIWPPSPKPGDGVGPDHWRDHKAPAAMLAEAHRQVEQMHGVRGMPKPFAAVYRDWAEDPYGGGVNFWRIHARSWEVIPAMTQPVPGLPVHVCGEAYSDEQGWVEGALRTTELMLSRHFGLRAAKPTGRVAA
ncbi:MAG: flavin monoamine oxidase family protein, partial [Betaproteobacteria bacterium]